MKDEKWLKKDLKNTY